MCKVYTGYCGTSEIEHSLCACTVDNPLAKARGLSLLTGAQTMLYLSLILPYPIYSKHLDNTARMNEIVTGDGTSSLSDAIALKINLIYLH